MGMHGDPHHARRRYTGRSCSLHQSPATLTALTEAVAYTEHCMHEGRLLTPNEAMALAMGAARDKETLYSIARQFSQRDGVDMDDLLCDLGARFPDYS
jgi:hypothetical protein